MQVKPIFVKYTEFDPHTSHNFEKFLITGLVVSKMLCVHQSHSKIYIQGNGV